MMIRSCILPCILLVPLGLAACMPGAQTEPSEQNIPSSFQGRWGLTAAECTADPSIAKGLMEVSATTLTFYESRGILDRVEHASPTRLEGHFTFTGEGETWERDIVLELQGNGDALIRREHGEDAASEPFRYVNCSPQS